MPNTVNLLRNCLSMHFDKLSTHNIGQFGVNHV